MLRRGSLKSSGLSAAICERFADGELHALEEVVAACGHLVPPEIAVRTLGRSGSNRGTLAERVARGRACVVKHTLSGLGAEADGPSPRRKWERFRLPPGDYGLQRGSQHHDAKVTEAQVREIRLRYALGRVTMECLAAEYGLSQTAVSQMVRRKTWRHVA